MTESEWLSSTDPGKMLRLGNHSQYTFSERKLYLFACASCRRVWDLLPDVRNQSIIELAEKYADGVATTNELVLPREYVETIKSQIINRKVSTLIQPGVDQTRARTAVRRAVLAAHLLSDPWMSIPVDASRIAHSVSFALKSAVPEREAARVRHDEHLHQCNLLRCIFGNPFRPVAVDPAWLTPDVTALAQAIYDERRFADLPILADALEEAGCTNDDMLGHCRDDGDHVRGCWVVDLLLVKE